MVRLKKGGMRFAVASVALFFLAQTLDAQQLDAKNWGKNTPGVQLVAHEGPRQRGLTATVLMYNLIGKGFPVDTVYSLWQWTAGKDPKLVIEGVSFDKRGVLVCSSKPGYCAGSGADDPVNIRTTAVLGEEKRMAVISKDGKIAGFADAVPFPIESSDKNCKLAVIRMSELAETVLARASGLKANQPLTVMTRFGNEGATTKSTAGPDGTWSQLLTAQATKTASGQALISVSDGVCNVSVIFPYGKGSNQTK